MGVMTATEAPPVPYQAFTVDDLARTPDDGRRYELVDGTLIVSAAQLRGVRLTAPPLLAVEVQSPSTKTVDRTLKKVVYERFGIQSYWLVVPSRKRPAVIAYELREG